MADKINLSDGGSEYEYNPSDEQYSDDEEVVAIINKGRRQAPTGKQEILPFDDDSENEELLSDSDIEGKKEDGIPDSKAWGKKRSSYYNTDFVDPDYDTYNEKEEELALQEEEEAKAIQQRLAQQLSENDFSLDIFSSNQLDVDDSQKDDTTSKLKTDLSELSIRQKQQLFEKDSPEFAGLVEDFKNYYQESESILQPISKYATLRNIDLPAIDFVKLKNNIIKTYCTNISYYLMLKAKRVPVRNHPVIKRLIQLKQLLQQLEEKFEKTVGTQVEMLLELVQTGADVKLTTQKCANSEKGKLRKLSEEAYMDMDNEESNEVDEGFMKKVDENTDMAEGDERRNITYQIAKNKGLTPHRRRELRNPRVKHRNKYRKALIRRKGAVRTVRKELKRYDGEISGIKATVKKGIKIKS